MPRKTKTTTEKTAAELRKEAADLIAMADAKEAEEAKAAAARSENLKEARELSETIVKSIRRLDEIGFLTPEQRARYSSEKGQLIPHLKWKAPRA